MIHRRFCLDTPLLSGLRVIDAASFIADPVAPTMLADLGADVVKIEPDGDPYRHRVSRPGVPESPCNYGWNVVDNRTKRGLALGARAYRRGDIERRIAGVYDGPGVRRV
jgi:crotonobetainyl-CoA:carnitine CoA-transferase CaiB-like acyl-CoA transferase